jgi:hypothetical protein
MRRIMSIINSTISSSVSFLSAQGAPHKEVDRMPDSRGKQNALTMVHAMGREWAQLGHVLHIA